MRWLLDAPEWAIYLIMLAVAAALVALIHVLFGSEAAGIVAVFFAPMAGNGLVWLALPGSKR